MTDLVAAEPAPAVRFGLLGPLQVIVGAGAPTAVTAAKQRVVLAALLLAGGRVVSADSLAEALWDASAPPNAPAAVRTHVARLRRALGPVGARIVGRSPGWAVELRQAGELDLTEVHRLWRDARAAGAAGEWQRVSASLAAALNLWRGEPLADIASAVLARREGGRLAELRLQLTEARIDADLRLGRAGGLVAELWRLTAEHPLREHLRVQLMLACYRSGDQATALEVYRDARRALAGELGVEPGRELRETHQRILTGDPGLAVGRLSGLESTAAGHLSGLESTAAGRLSGVEGTVLPAAKVTVHDLGGGHPPRVTPPVAGGTALSVPRQLPATVAYFTGRARELAALAQALGEAGRDAHGPVVVSAVGGMAGVGKTALAIHWAHQVAERYPDGQLYVNLRGFDSTGTPVAPAEAIRGFLDALGVERDRIPPGLDAQAALYRSLLAGRRMLIMLDNARDEQQVRPLLPGSSGCLVVITSRSVLAGLAVSHDARLITLGVLTAAEARQLLIARLGAGRAAAEPDVVTEIADLCACLPLALAVAAARAAARPGLPLAALAAQLRDAHHRLDALDAGDPAASVRAVFSWSCRQLSPAAVRLFRLLGLHPGPDITAPAAASLAGCDRAAAHGLLAELTRAHLLTEPVPGRYACHDLLRDYARELAAEPDGADEGRAAVARLLDHYLHTAHAAATLLRTTREPITLAPPGPAVTPERLAGSRQAMAWFEAEHNVLHGAVALAADTGSDVHAWQIPWAMADFIDWQGYWHEHVAVQRIAVAATARLGAAPAQADSRRILASTCAKLADYDEAHTHLAACLKLCLEAGDRAGEATAHQLLSWINERQGHLDLALGHAAQAHRLFRAVGDLAGQARSLNNMGYCHAELGRYREARAHCQQAFSLWREVGDRNGEATTWDSLGYAEHHLGHHDRATSCYQHALGIFTELGDRYNEAATLIHLGDTYHAEGDPRQATDAWQRAAGILDDLGHPDASLARAKLGEGMTAAPR
jgi:DNA-binding SARP family transcriptional activator/tetratricopeptide (TPR) repeat protein